VIRRVNLCAEYHPQVHPKYVCFKPTGKLWLEIDGVRYRTAYAATFADPELAAFIATVPPERWLDHE
jgi:hypothetical protein